MSISRKWMLKQIMTMRAMNHLRAVLKAMMQQYVIVVYAYVVPFGH